MSLKVLSQRFSSERVKLQGCCAIKKQTKTNRNIEVVSASLVSLNLSAEIALMPHSQS